MEDSSFSPTSPSIYLCFNVVSQSPPLTEELASVTVAAAANHRLNLNVELTYLPTDNAVFFYSRYSPGPDGRTAIGN